MHRLGYEAAKMLAERSLRGLYPDLNESVPKPEFVNINDRWWSTDCGDTQNISYAMEYKIGSDIIRVFITLYHPNIIVSVIGAPASRGMKFSTAYKCISYNLFDQDISALEYSDINPEIIKESIKLDICQDMKDMTILSVAEVIDRLGGPSYKLVTSRFKYNDYYQTYYQTVSSLISKNGRVASSIYLD